MDLGKNTRVRGTSISKAWTSMSLLNQGNNLMIVLLGIVTHIEIEGVREIEKSLNLI